MRASNLLLVPAVLALAACAVGPNYQGPPATGEPAHFVRGGAETGPPINEWWTSLGDRTLDSLVARALAANPNIAVATARLRSARGDVNLQRANQWPSVDASALYARARLPPLNLGALAGGAAAAGAGAGAAGGGAASGNAAAAASAGGGGPTHLTLYNIGFDASWEIDLFGGQRRAIEASRASLGASEANLADAQVSLAAEVGQDYVNLRDVQARLALARESVARQERMLALTQARFRGGTASRLDVSRLETQLESTRADILPLSAQVDTYRDALAVLVGAAPGELDAELAAAAPVPLPPARVEVGDPAEMLRRRPDIRAAERLLAARTAQIGQQEANRFPKLSLLGIIGIGGSKLSDLTNWDNRSAIFLPRLTWNFLDFGRNAANVEQANANRDEAEAQYRADVLGALRDAEDALARFRERRNAVVTIGRARDAAAVSVAMMRAREEGGTASLIDLLDTERQLISAEQNLSTATAALTNDFVSLQKALGLGWSAAPEGSEPGAPAGQGPVPPGILKR